MTRQSLDDHVREFYQARGLPDAALARLTCPPVRTGSASNRPGIVYALAACLGLAMLGNAYLAWSADRAWRRVVSLQEAAFSRAEPTNGEVMPQLVALRTIMENCPCCPLVKPVYEELENRHGDDPRIVFVTYDITNERTRRESEGLARALGINGLFTQCCESGTIQLVDRGSGTILSKLKRTEQKPEFEAALLRALNEKSP